MLRSDQKEQHSKVNVLVVVLKSNAITVLAENEIEQSLPIAQIVKNEITRHWFPDQQISHPDAGQPGFSAPEL